MGNLFATILGVVVGVPIALEISRRQQDAEHLASKAERQEEERNRKQKVLSLLKSELSQNRDDIEGRRINVLSGGKRVVDTDFLRDEMWAAFSHGGELQHVNNPEVLAAISYAYYRIRSNIFLERSFMNASHFPGLRVAQEKYPHDYILEYLTSTDPQVVDAIERAITTIDAELATLAPTR